MAITFNDFLNEVKSYNPDEIENVTRAYEYADLMHHGQVRQSGEAYISHPLNVAMILAQLHADGDTLCAGLLHDVLEDTSSTKEELTSLFGAEVAKLVDGVTNLANVDFSNPHAQKMANTRKIIIGLTEDVRIIIIKLADRLHNMRTLNYKSKAKQKEKALETLEIFVPLAYNIGAYRVKHELEDLSFLYLKPDFYKALNEKREAISESNKDVLYEMLYKIKEILKAKELDGEIKIRIQNIYGIYKRLNKLYGDIKLNELMKMPIEDLMALNFHDLLVLKVMVEEVDDCYRMLGWIHGQYHPLPEKFKDFICNPKTNMYQSLHTTVYGPRDRHVQMQIRTFDMDKTASFGLTTYWDINKGQARIVMQEDLKKKYPFYSSVKEIDASFNDNEEFIQRVKSELFDGEIYVITTNGEVKSLPIGASPIDFAYAIHTDVGNQMVGAYVNDELVPFDYVLQNQDHVRIVTALDSHGPSEDWLDVVKSSLARRKIREYLRK